MSGTGMTSATETPIEAVDARVYTIPTDAPESDGTLEWGSTTLVLAEVRAGGDTGIGYTYADAATARLITETLATALIGMDGLATAACWLAMVQALRNQGRPGLSSMAVAAVDNALWDLKGRLLGAPVVTLLGQARDAVDCYGSGGFTSYDEAALAEQLGGWADEGFGLVKMKIGREPTRDPGRVAIVRRIIGPDTGLMVDANGAYSRKQALAFADMMHDYDVIWFEEPVSSEDLEGLRLLRDRAPAPMDITAGEYGYDLRYFRHMIAAGAVDVLQADATRCAGITGFMAVDALCQAFELPLSAHCAPALHCHPCCAAKCIRHVEAFHDHMRIERMLFDDPPLPENGRIAPDPARPGLGLTFRYADAERFAN